MSDRYSICPDCGKNMEFILHEEGCPQFGKEVQEFIAAHDKEVASWPKSAQQALKNLEAMHACLFRSYFKAKRELEILKQKRKKP